ncbi:5'-methylthioadenosine/S-adenosylhomocysteine nucleosidase [Bifidobacterium sp. ESL0790]|uniref:5'-methylthioadenosine/S-adenosylhomocysteine nucleosidase n=1 Tax=Bifidobacterium sp. ESL0790 TaxID=2983233 RepID=UPI0023F61DE8|nr:5'-methylthioadenosine/S-adenosylhomocysteine nucleosidase [Bifidobacterium sp. ESL0790]WEV72711.1 5'-methylthioadenosine/S-adenosylhomocysteine nucleosidase [Bifidobacterium sp. ESL0790]
MKTIAIIGAMDEEVALIAKSLDDVEHNKTASLDINVGTLATKSGERIRVAATVGGMGLVNAAATTQCLIDGYQPDAVIFSGIAGSLNKSLHINDVVLGGTLRYLDSDMRLIAQWKPEAEEFHSDRHLLDVAGQALDDMGIKHIVGTIASGNYFVDSPQKVAEVAETTHADAVEMEGAAVAHVAGRNDVPALVIRALSDNADTDYEEFKEFDISEYADTAARLAVDIVTRL